MWTREREKPEDALDESSSLSAEKPERKPRSAQTRCGIIASAASVEKKRAKRSKEREEKERSEERRR